MIDLSKEPWLTILDKGLFAAILAGFAWWLNRSLERLKSSLAWRNELLRERVSLAKDVLSRLNALEAAHGQMSWRIRSDLPLDECAQADWESFMIAKRELIDAYKNARLFLSPATIRMIEDVNDKSTAVAKPFQEHIHGAVIKNDELMSLESGLDASISKAIASLQVEFQGTTAATGVQQDA